MPPVKVASLLTQTRPELMSGDNKYFCAGCQEKQDALRSQAPTAVPPLLVFNLNRYITVLSFQQLLTGQKCMLPQDLWTRQLAVFHSIQSNPIQTNPILRGVESFFCYVPNGTSLVLYYKSPWLPFVRLCLNIFALHLFGILELYRFHRHEGFLHARCLRRDQ